MLRGATRRAVLIVEGASDEKFWSRFSDRETCELVIARGKQNALDAMNLLRSQAVDGIICIVDRDYDPFLGKDEACEDVVVTDDHDLETMLVRSESFEAVAAELGSKTKIDKIGGSNALREIVVRIGVQVGSVRLFSLEKAENLKFEGLKYRFFDPENTMDALPAIAKEVYDNTGRPGADLAAVLEFGEQLERQAPNEWWVVCGHDLTEMMGRALRSIAGNLDARAASASEMEKHLRLACDSQFVKGLTMTEAIRTWERANPTFRCLPIGF